MCTEHLVNLAQCRRDLGGVKLMCALCLQSVYTSYKNTVGDIGNHFNLRTSMRAPSSMCRGRVKLVYRAPQTRLPMRIAIRRCPSTVPGLRVKSLLQLQDSLGLRSTPHRGRSVSISHRIVSYLCIG